MSSIARTLLPTLALLGLSGTGHALPPDQIFERVAPAVWSVRAYDAEERPLASASGVVIAPGKLLTSCHVLVRAHQVQLRRGNTIYDAKLEAPDVERDLCQLDVPGLSAPAPALGGAGGLRSGQRLYVVGLARGNQQTIGEGLVSALPDAGSGKARIHTTVAASPGLLGAGVFDEEARLVGVATVSPAEAAANLFAVPAEWVPEAAARGKALLAALAKPPAAPASASAPAGAPGMPAAGTVWTYSFLERIWSRRQIEVTVRAVRVDGGLVEEVVTASGAKDLRRVVNAREVRFVETALSSSMSVVEPAPYLVAANGGKPPGSVPQIEGYPVGAAGLPGWTTSAEIQGWEQVTVPAGTFKALRVRVAGRRSAPIGGRNAFAGRFEMTAWYAPDVKRIVRQEQRIWTADGISPALSADEVFELLAYRPPS
jgi:S1-C subfamily serine protease